MTVGLFGSCSNNKFAGGAGSVKVKGAVLFKMACCLCG